jgi:hypothetical protein
MWQCGADIATLGFAISLVTSARVALSDLLIVFLVAIQHAFRKPERFQVNLDQANPSLAGYRDAGE